MTSITIGELRPRQDGWVNPTAVDPHEGRVASDAVVWASPDFLARVLVTRHDDGSLSACVDDIAAGWPREPFDGPPCRILHTGEAGR